MRKKHCKWTKEFIEMRPKVNEAIRDLHSKGTSWHDIAAQLNKMGYKTPTGKLWTHGTAPAYAIYNGIVPRRFNTTRGAAGSTGITKYSGLNGHAMNGARRARVKEAISNQDVEDIMTSNLSTEMKIRLIRTIALANAEY